MYPLQNSNFLSNFLSTHVKPLHSYSLVFQGFSVQKIHSYIHNQFTMFELTMLHFKWWKGSVWPTISWTKSGSFFFIENGFFSHTMHPVHNPFHPFQLSSTSLLHALPIPFLFRKEQASKRQKPSKPKQDTLRQGKSPPTKAGQTSVAHIVHMFFNETRIQTYKQTVTCRAMSRFAADTSNKGLFVSNPYLLFNFSSF